MNAIPRVGEIRKPWLMLLLLGLLACDKSPTEPVDRGRVSGTLSGTWRGTLTCSGSPSESVVATVAQAPESSTVRMIFTSTCYGTAAFEGILDGNQLTGRVEVPQTTCKEEGGFIHGSGASRGTAEPSQIHLESNAPTTADCLIAPASTLDLSR